MKFARLTGDNFLMYAVKNYENPLCTSSDEFKKDMKHFMYISKFLSKQLASEAPKLRLLVNHIVILRNLFGNRPLNRMVFFYYPARYHPVLKAVLEFVGSLQEAVPEADLDRIESCPVVKKLLQEM